MKEPKKIPLTDNPRSKEIKKFPLQPLNDNLDYYIDYYNLVNSNENHTENNSQSISELESDPSN